MKGPFLGKGWRQGGFLTYLPLIAPSNHGWGFAVDIDSPWLAKYKSDILSTFGCEFAPFLGKPVAHPPTDWLDLQRIYGFYQ